MPGVPDERTRRHALAPRAERNSMLVAAASAVVAPFGAGHPTMLRAVDLLGTAALAGVCTWCGGRARRAATLTVALCLAVVALASPGVRALDASVVLAVGAALVAVAVAAAPRGLVRSTIAAALVVQAGLRLPTTGPARVPSVAAGLGMALLVASAWPRLPRTHRRRLRRVIAVVVIPAGAVAGAVGVTALVERDRLETGVHLAESGLAVAKAGDPDRAAADLARARELLGGATSRLGAWWTRPGLAVPVVAQNLDAVERLAEAASDLATTGADTAGAAEVRSFRASQGAIDVTRLRSLGVQVERAGVAIDSATRESAAVRGPWLLPAVTERVARGDATLADAQEAVGGVRAALSVVPAMLGADGPRRYLLVMVNPSEARGSGGVVGNWGEITADGGRLTLERFGRTTELNNTGLPTEERRLTGPADYLENYAPDGVSPVWSNVNVSPYFPSVGQVMAELYPQSGGETVDGVISADPVALAGLLRITGPVTAEGWPEPVTADNAARVLMFESYAALSGQRARRLELLGDVTTQVWGRLTTMALPTPAAVADAMRDAVTGRHLQFWMTRPLEQAWLRGLGATGEPPQALDTAGVVVTNATASKIEWFLERSTLYDVRLDPRARTWAGSLRLRLRNTAPTAGLAEEVIGNQIGLPTGSTFLYVAAHTAATVSQVTVGGAEADWFGSRELGRAVSATWVTLAPGESTEVRFELSGSWSGPSSTWSLGLVRQPTPGADPFEVRVTLPPGWRAAAPGRFVAGAGRREVLEADLVPTDRPLVELDGLEGP